VKSGAASRELNKWNVGDFADEMQFLSSWIQNRLAFLDNHYLGGIYTSVENKMQTNVTLAFNPEQNTLSISNLTAGDKIQIISSQGTMIVDMLTNGANVSVNMTHYAPGVYLVKIGNKVMKIVKR
jgi:hypothetical protein